jgi:hypothetical protein
MMDNVRDFGTYLDLFIDNLQIWNSDGNEALLLCANIAEVSVSAGSSAFSHMQRGLNVLGPRLVRQGPGPVLDVEGALTSLRYSADYFMFREYLYYHYNVPNSCEWKFTKDEVKDAYRTLCVATNQGIRNVFGMCAAFAVNSHEPPVSRYQPKRSRLESMGTGTT